MTPKRHFLTLLVLLLAFTTVAAQMMGQTEVLLAAEKSKKASPSHQKHVRKNSRAGLHLVANTKSMEIIAPPLLTFEELSEIAKEPNPTDPLKGRLNQMLDTPFIYRNHSLGESVPRALEDGKLGPFTRVASWNIERGFELPHIIDLFSGRNIAISEVKSKKPVKEKEMAKAREAQKWLAESQILLLSEVDDGMKRTGYKDVTLELAKALNMHAVYGVEFLELAPLSPLAREHAEKAAKELSQDKELQAFNLGEELNVDHDKYKGLHGLAVLSKYPILQARTIRLPVCYDWYNQEQSKVSALEKVKRKAADTVFLETVLTEVRVGGRLALAVDVAAPQLPEGRITVVASHLENRTPPACRKTQFEAMVNALQGVKNPVVIGGDWNTTGSDVSPTSIRKEVRVRARDPVFWTRKAVMLLAPYGGFIHLGMNVTEIAKNFHDPASVNIPVIAPNREKGLFNTLETFRFLDGGRFDVRGDRARSFNGRGGYMANSNERGLKGFAPTFKFNRTFIKGMIGEFKLDWFVVKGYGGGDTEGKGESYRFAPHRGRNLEDANYMFGEPISDHSPITIDLPFKEWDISK